MDEVQNNEIIDELENLDIEVKQKKKGVFARLKAFIMGNNGAAIDDVKEDTPAPAKKPETKEREKKKMGVLLADIESQLNGLDEQNKVLMYHVATMRENNEALLEQVKVLKKNNEILREQFEANIKKTRLTRILNVVYTLLAIVFVVYRMIDMIVKNGWFSS